MTWTELTLDWTVLIERMKCRFPRIDDSAMSLCHQDRTRFELYLARLHNITQTEVREEIEDFLYVETLAREASSPM